MNNFKPHGRRVFSSIVMLLVSVLVISWGWNSAIPDLFGLPPLHFKQAMGLTVLLVVVSSTLRMGARHGRDKLTNPYHKDLIEGK
jgi:hypothetical protein